jgi:hypothetical protein
VLSGSLTEAAFAAKIIMGICCRDSGNSRKKPDSPAYASMGIPCDLRNESLSQYPR